MKTCIFGFGLLASVVACVLINAGCVTKPADRQSSFQLERLERAAGPQFEVPEIQ